MCEVTEIYKGFRIFIEHDDNDESPRCWSNLGRLFWDHANYNFYGGNNDVNLSKDDLFNDCNSWADVAGVIDKNYKPALLLPVWAYDHSGLSLSCGSRGYPFNDYWDSGQIGYIIALSDDIRAAFKVKYLTKKILARANDCLVAEIQTLSQWCSGDVYYYSVVDPSWRVVDSSGHWYGYDDTLKECYSIIDDEISRKYKARADKLKQLIINKVPLVKRAAILSAVGGGV